MSSSHPLQVDNCDSNSRLVVDENDNGKFRLERFKTRHLSVCCYVAAFNVLPCCDHLANICKLIPVCNNCFDLVIYLGF